MDAKAPLDPQVELHPIGLSTRTDLRLDQLQRLAEGEVSGSSPQRAGHLLWQLERSDTVVILALHEVRLPEILSERSFAPGRAEGTAHLYAYPAGTPLGWVDFSATNSPEASAFSEHSSAMRLGSTGEIMDRPWMGAGMTSTWRAAMGVLGASLALACGGGGSKPSAPTPPAAP